MLLQFACYKKVMKKLLHLPSLLLILSLFTACGVKSQVVTQGQTIDSDSVSQIQVGMTKEQVRLVLGSPALIDTFDSNQWTYYFSEAGINKKKVAKQGSIRLTFKNKTLEKIINDGSLVVKSSDANLEGGTIITKPTQKKRGIFNRL